METQLIIPTPKPLRPDTAISIRRQKYTQIYSIRPSSSHNSSARTKKLKSESIKPKLNPSIDLSKLTHTPENIKNLEKLANTLLYEVQKASSDRLELIRDLSTYDNDFSKSVNLKQKLETFVALTDILPEAASLIKYSTNNEKSCFDQIKKGLIELSITNPQTNSEFNECSEDFGLRKFNPGHVYRTVFKGICFISGLYAMISLTADQWLEHLHFKALLFSSQTCSLQLHQRISNNCYTAEQITSEVRNKMLPFLYFKAKDTQTKLKFSQKQSKDHYYTLLHVKGYQLCNVIISPKSETQTLLEVPEVEQSLFIDHTCDFSDPTSLKHLISDIKSHLFYSPAKKTLLWGSSTSLFTLLEKSSKYLNEDFVKNATLNMGNFTQIYTFPINSHKICCYSDQTKICLKFFKETQSEELQNDSKNFLFLEYLQDIDLRNSPTTLSKSLELEFLLSKLFP